jgi:hypothetical protein
VSLVKRRMCILGPLFDFPSSDLHDMDGVTGHVKPAACGLWAPWACLALSITLTRGMLSDKHGHARAAGTLRCISGVGAVRLRDGDHARQLERFC